MPSAQHHTHHLASAWPLLPALLLSVVVHLLFIAWPAGPASPPTPAPVMPLQLTLQPPPLATPGTTDIMRQHDAPRPQAETHSRQVSATRPPAADRASRPMPAQPETAAPVQQTKGAGISVASLLSQVAADARSQQDAVAPPGRLVYGSTARGYLWRQYMDDWVNKMERLGALNYPQEVRNQGLSGGPLLSVVINADGSLAALSIARGSGNPVLDEAAERIVRLAAPFAPFPPELAAQARSLEIRRKWHFTTGNDLSVQ